MVGTLKGLISLNKEKQLHQKQWDNAVISRIRDFSSIFTGHIWLPGASNS